MARDAQATLDKIETHGRFTTEGVAEYMQERNISLYRLGAGNIVEDAPSAFKDVDSVVAVMKEMKLASPVAKTRPLAVLKGS